LIAVIERVSSPHVITKPPLLKKEGQGVVNNDELKALVFDSQYDAYR